MIDNVNHPSHYAEGWSNGAEVIDITENLDFNRGNAVKYLARAGKKNPETELEDLKKAEFYVKRAISKIEGPKPGMVTSAINVGDSVDDWRDLPIGAEFIDKDDDKYVRVEEDSLDIYGEPSCGANWVGGGRSTVIGGDTAYYRPYLVTSLG